LSSFSFEKSPPDTLESSLFGSSNPTSNIKTSDAYPEKTPRKKSVHFETDSTKNEKDKSDSETSPIGSYFPIIGSILNAGPSKPQVPDSNQSDDGKLPNGILLNLPPTDRAGSRKESLESIETVDTVDLELIKLGMHKSSGDIRTQYLSKLHIISPPSNVSSAYIEKSDVSQYPSAFSSSTSIPPSSTIFSTSYCSAITTSTASDQYTELLKNEEKITEQHVKLASKFEAQKSNFEVSKSLNIPSSSAPNNVTQGEQETVSTTTITTTSTSTASTPPFMMGPRARPPLRPMYMVGGGYMGPPVRFRGMSPPRMRFPPPYRQMKSGNPGEIPRMSPPPRNMAFFRSPSPTHGLIRITPRHLPPSLRPPPGGPPLRLRGAASPPLHIRGGGSPLGMRMTGGSPGPPMGPRGSPSPRPALPPGFPPNALRSPRAPLLLRGNFSPLRPSQFSPNSPIRFRRGPGPGGHMRPPGFYGHRPRLFAAASAARFAMRHRMPTIASVDNADKVSGPEPEKSKQQHVDDEVPGTSKETDTVTGFEERAHLMKDLDTRIVVQNFDTRVKTKVPEMTTLTCSDLLTAYRLTQSLTGNRNRPYKYDPAETMDLHRRLTINSRIIFDKLTSPRKEKKAPYVPNREIIRLFSARNEDRGREKLVLENEEFLYKNKTTYGREGEFFQPKNPELIEKFESTHEYIKKLYEHSKNNLIPPTDEFADVHDRVKYFCGVTNEELLDKLKAVEERVMKSEWSGRINDAKEKMAKLYEENKQFLSKYKKQQEDKINNLLDENKELIDNIKTKASSFDQMMEKTVCDAI